MKARHAFIGILALGIGLASLAEAQRGGRGGGGRSMKARTGEQTEQFQGRGQRGSGEGPFAALELTDEQTEALQALREAQRADREAQRETGERPTQEEREAIREAHRTAVAEILTDEQIAQLEELRANRPEGQGNRGRRGGGRGQRGDRPERGEGPFAALELTYEQAEAIQALRETQRADREAQRETGERPTQEEREAIREAHRAAIAEILTAEQLAQLEELRANRPNRNAPVGEETEITPAAKPVGAAIESSSWAGIKSQVR